MNDQMKVSNRDRRTSKTRRSLLKSALGLAIAGIFGGKLVDARADQEKSKVIKKHLRFRNKTAIAKSYLEKAYAGDKKLFEQLVSSDCTLNIGNHKMLAKGQKAMWNELLKCVRDAFPDAQFKVLELIESDDKIVARWEASGTNTSPYKKYKPTGRRVKVGGISILTIREGKIVEDRSVFDSKEIYDQLGLATLK